MDGLECSEILLSHAKREESRFDSEYYSKENLLLQTIIDTAGNKTINEYGGVLDCSAFYPSITGYYSNDRSLIPFIRVNEIANGLILITDNTVFLPANIIEDNNKTIAVAYPGDIIIAKGGNTLAKVGLVTDEFPMYATCRDVIILRTTSLQGLNRHYLWSFLHSSFGQRMLWRSASQTGQPHLTLPAITKIKVPEYKKLQDKIEKLYTLSVCKKQESNLAYRDAETILLTLDDPNSYAIIYQLPFNGFSRIEPDNIYSANEGMYSQLIATKGVDWFASYVYSLRNALFHEIITPLDEEWQIIFKSAYLVLKQVSDICIATINRIIEFPQSKENAVFDYAATHQDSVFSTLADSVELLDYPEMTLSNWKIDHGKIILKGWFLAKLKLQNGTAEEIGTGAGVIEEISKGFDFEIMLDDDFSIVRDSENNDCILIQLQKS